MLKNKVVIITGGAGLIGQEFVKSIIEQQGIAVIADINEELALQVKDKLSRELDTSCIHVVDLDISSKVSINRMITILDERYGRIDALINNAYPRNKNYGRHFFDVDYDDFCNNLGINLGGYFLTSQQLALYFKKQGYGNIINIASIYGLIPPKFEIYENTKMSMPVEYAAIKSAVIHLTKYMAKYFKGLNIRVNTLSPGGILDDQPSSFLKAYKDQCLNKGMLNQADICGTLLYLLSDSSMYVNGQNVVVDDGFSL